MPTSKESSQPISVSGNTPNDSLLCWPYWFEPSWSIRSLRVRYHPWYKPTSRECSQHDSFCSLLHHDQEASKPLFCIHSYKPILTECFPPSDLISCERTQGNGNYMIPTIDSSPMFNQKVRNFEVILLGGPDQRCATTLRKWSRTSRINHTLFFELISTPYWSNSAIIRRLSVPFVSQAQKRLVFSSYRSSVRRWKKRRRTWSTWFGLAPLSSKNSTHFNSTARHAHIKAVYRF